MESSLGEGSSCAWSARIMALMRKKCAAHRELFFVTATRFKHDILSSRGFPSRIDILIFFKYNNHMLQ